MVIRAGASTGGMDIPPLVLNKKMGLPVSMTMNGMDTAILLLQIVFTDKEMVLYGSPSGVGVHVCAEQGAAFRTGQNAGEDRDRAL